MCMNVLTVTTQHVVMHAHAADAGSVPGSSLQLAALIGGVLGGLLAVALLVIISLLLLLCVRRNKHKGTFLAF